VYGQSTRSNDDDDDDHNNNNNNNLNIPNMADISFILQ